MQLQSSYIFLPNPYSKKPTQWEDEEGVLHIETGHSVYTHVKKAFPNMVSKEIDNVYFQYQYSFSVELDKQAADISIISKNVGDSYFVTVIVEGKTKAQLIKALEYVNGALFATKIDEDYISIVSYDAASEYYCNKLYPKINKLERNLRKLLFNIYVLNFGKEYFQATTTKEMQDKAKKIIRAKGGVEKREIQYIKQFFYSLEYADIQQLLFTPRWTKIDEENKKSFLDTHEDLSKSSDEELRAAINDISPKSDWERFFDEKFQGINVERDIEAVRVIRNSVAHCKFLQKEQYTSCNKIINSLNNALNRAITITEEKDFDDKNAEYFRKALSGVSSRIHELVTKFNEAILPSMQRFREVFEAASSYYAENIKGAIEVSSILAKTLNDSMKPIYFSDVFKNTLNNITQLVSVDYPNLYNDVAALTILPDDDEGQDKENIENNEESEDNADA